MLPGDEADGQLVARVQQGDKRAFEVLVLKYRHRIFSLVSRFVRVPDEVQDVVQEAFIKAYRAIGGFRGESAFYTWLYRIAANTAKNHLVSRSRRPPGADLEVEDAEQLDAARALRDIEDPESLMMAEQLREAVEGAIRRLPEDLRTALMLREFEGLSYEEIAEVMACPVGTVRSRIFRAREAVDQEILPLMPGN
ncbi:MAG: RNA polymerase sigma factor RpoE [Gammaproteobacteria bacterium]